MSSKHTKALTAVAEKLRRRLKSAVCGSSLSSRAFRAASAVYFGSSSSGTSSSSTSSGSSSNSSSSSSSSGSSSSSSGDWSIISQCRQPQPPDRARTTVGVGEEVDLTLRNPPPGTVTWSLSGGGTLTNTSDTGATFTAPSTTTGDLCTVTATINNESRSKDFTVIEPESILFENSRHNICTVPSPGADYYNIDYDANVYVGPDTVNFYRIELSESGATPEKTGYYLNKNVPNHQPNSGHKISGYVAGKGSQMTGVDNIAMSAAGGPYSDGSVTWHISWMYWINDGSMGSARLITSVSQKAELAPAATAVFKVTKGQSGYYLKADGTVEPV